MLDVKCLFSLMRGRYTEEFHEFSNDELKECAICVLNACLSKHHASVNLKLSFCTEITMKEMYSLILSLPVMEIFFEPSVIAACSADTITVLEPILRNILNHILSLSSASDKERLLTQFCLLSWRDCFSTPSQFMLANSVSRVLAEQISDARSKWPFLGYRPLLNGSLCGSIEIIIATVMRLTHMALQHYVTPRKRARCLDKRLTSAERKETLLELSCIYQDTLSHLADEVGSGYEMDQSMEGCDIDSFLISAFEFIHVACRHRDQLSFSQDLPIPLVPTIETDPTLWARLCVGKDLYLTQACQSIGQLPAIRHNLSPELRSIISDADIATLQKIAAPHHLNLELVQCRASNNLRNAHIDMIAWAIDRGHCVRDYASTFLEADCLDNPAFSATILPRLIPHAAVLASDRRLSLALIQRILHLDEKMSPSNHHVSLLRHILPLLSNDMKLNLATEIQSGTKQTKFSQTPSITMRNFFKQLAAAPDTSDEDFSGNGTGKPWLSFGRANIVSIGVFIDVDWLMLTQPLEFLVHLIRAPLTQRAPTLLPVVHKILSHVNYGLSVQLLGTKEPTIFSALLTSLLNQQTEVGAGEEVGDTEINNDDPSECMAASALQLYLPRVGNLDPQQVAIAAKAMAFSVGCAGSDSSSLWVHSLACLLDQSASWPLLCEWLHSPRDPTSLRTVAQCLCQILLPTIPPHVQHTHHLESVCVRLLGQAMPSSSSSYSALSVLVLRICCTVLRHRHTDTITPTQEQQHPDTLVESLLSALSQQRHRGLLAQCVDFLPTEVLGALRVRVPEKLARLTLVNLGALNEAVNNRLQFTADVGNSTTSTSGGFAEPLSGSSLVDIFHLVCLSEEAWPNLVESLVTWSRRPGLRHLWASLSPATLTLALYTFLRDLFSVGETSLSLKTDQWARVLGFLDQLISEDLINLPYRLRVNFTSDISQQPPSLSRLIYLGKYRGSLEFFDLLFGLLRLILHVLDRGLVRLVCQSLTALAQRLTSRLTTVEGDNNEQYCPLVAEQSRLLLDEVIYFLEQEDDPHLRRLKATLELVTNSLNCKQFLGTVPAEE